MTMMKNKAWPTLKVLCRFLNLCERSRAKQDAHCRVGRREAGRRWHDGAGTDKAHGGGPDAARWIAGPVKHADFDLKESQMAGKLGVNIDYVGTLRRDPLSDPLPLRVLPSEPELLKSKRTFEKTAATSKTKTSWFCGTPFKQR